MTPAEPRPTVFVLDDDAAVRTALGSLLRSRGLHAVLLATASDYLAQPAAEGPACLVLDVRLPDVNGLDLQRVLMQDAATALPIVVITGHGDIPMSVRAMKAGAVGFLTKPFQPDELLAAIDEALALDRRTRAGRSERADAQARLDTLTPREREVLTHLVAGRLNKQIAAELALSEITVKVHRRSVMDKMGARTLADLVRCMERLQGTTSAHNAPGGGTPT